MSLRTPRLDVGLLSVETPMFVGTAVGLFIGAANESKRCPEPGDCFFNATGLFVAGGIATTAMTAWSLTLLVRSVRTLRLRRAHAIDDLGSLRFNRRMIAYDTIMSALYGAFGTSLYVAAAQDPLLVPPAGAMTALLGLHLWSLVRNIKELKQRKRRGIDQLIQRKPPARRLPIKAPRVRPLGGGLEW